MKLKTSLYIQLGLLVLTMAIGVYFYQSLPERVPTHWNIHNQVDQYGSKWTSLVMGPGMVLFDIFLTLMLPKISPKNFEIDKFETTFSLAMVMVTIMMVLLSILILQVTAGSHIDIGQWMMVIMFGFFAFIGNIMGKVQRNFFMGVRTPWTIASEPVWDATHRLAGRLWVVGGILGVVASLLGAPMMFSIVFLLVISLYPVLASYFIYQKIGK